MDGDGSRRLFLLCFLGFSLFRVQYASVCLDGRGPYDLDKPLDFCSDHKDFGCCSPEKDTQIKRQYETIKLSLEGSGSTGCESYAKELLCAECSPHAGKLFGAGGDEERRELPGLCSTYCDTLFTKCKEVVPLVYHSDTMALLLGDKTAFCTAASLTDDDADYCYPSLLTNNEFNDEVAEEAISSDGCLCLEEFASDLANPLLLQVPDDGSGRIFIGEQQGIVYIFDKNKTKIEKPFLDIRNDVLVSSQVEDERGFLNLAFHPNFKENKKFYVFFSTDIDGKHHVRISEFKESALIANRVDPDSERIIIEVEQPHQNRNGGELMFGDDGYLYIFLGDGGSEGEYYGHAQNKSLLLGKILRIDINTDDLSVKYKIPPDNPFVGEEGNREEIWAYGFRNVWRCDFDEGDSKTGCGQGRLFCGDVGEDTYEEVNLIVKGGNYGWDTREGNECFDDDKCGKIGKEELPIFVYPHSIGQSVSGGQLYRGCVNPNLQGQYIVGDFMTGKLWSLTENLQTKGWTDRELSMCSEDSGLCSNGLTTEYPQNILSFGEDDDGELYLLSTSFASSKALSGKISKLIDPMRRGDSRTCRSSSTYKEPEGNACPITTSRSRAVKGEIIVLLVAAISIISHIV